MAVKNATLGNLSRSIGTIPTSLSNYNSALFRQCYCCGLNYIADRLETCKKRVRNAQRYLEETNLPIQQWINSIVMSSKDLETGATPLSPRGRKIVENKINAIIQKACGQSVLAAMTFAYSAPNKYGVRSNYVLIDIPALGSTQNTCKGLYNNVCGLVNSLQNIQKSLDCTDCEALVRESNQSPGVALDYAQKRQLNQKKKAIADLLGRAAKEVAAVASYINALRTAIEKVKDSFVDLELQHNYNCRQRVIDYAKTLQTGPVSREIVQLSITELESQQVHYIALYGEPNPELQETIDALKRQIVQCPLRVPYKMHNYNVFLDKRKKGPHKGVDLVAAGGSEIFPFMTGEVHFAGFASDGGYYVTIKVEIDGKTVYMDYMHMAKPPSVKKGDIVGPDTVLGLVGSTGESNGDHLHFAIYTKGTEQQLQVKQGESRAFGKRHYYNPESFFSFWDNRSH